MTLSLGVSARLWRMSLAKPRHCALTKMDTGSNSTRQQNSLFITFILKAEKLMVCCLQINGTHGNTKRSYKVKGIKADGGSANTFFMNEQEGREMSVAEYFEKQYNIR